MSRLESSLSYAKQHHTEFLSSLDELVRIPSISTDPAAKDNMHRAANLISQELKDIGFQHVAVHNTKGHPVVIGTYSTEKPAAPTILIYGHYDVQPVDPISEWKSDPFIPTLVENQLIARGASDMKGQVIASIKAVESILYSGDPGINIKFLVEGEEEIGSINLKSVLEENRELLKCDVVLNPDGGMFSETTPAVIYGLRGLAYFELRVFGPDHDLHSGSYGGIVHNPAQALCELITGMHDERGMVTLPGFYDSVYKLDENERAELARLPITEELYIKETGVPQLWGEKDYSPVERLGARPTLEINGLLSGFTNHGAKTIIPSHAMAKISCRLVPDQKPEEVHQQLREYLEKKAPKTIRWELTPMQGGLPAISDRNQPATQALIQAYKLVWKNDPVFMRMGGSIPIVTTMQEVLGVDSVITGFGLPDDRIHSPNEKLDLPTFYKGIESLIRFIDIMGK
jgi:acetylornithine deacetylase/succinyl-diaminopimelate desuccinylase-like protein